MSCYGRVLSFCHDYIASGIYIGMRTAHMHLHCPIPSSLRMVGEQVIVFYESQPCMCCRCGDEGHMANGCKAPRCKKAGYRAKDCPEPELCGVCIVAEHFTRRCPFIVYSANIQQVSGESNKSETGEGNKPTRNESEVHHRHEARGELCNRQDCERDRECKRHQEQDRYREGTWEHERDYPHHGLDRDRNCDYDCNLPDYCSFDEDSDWASVRRYRQRRDRSRS